jgi:glutamate/aspartate transport system substrate-binding protein
MIFAVSLLSAVLLFAGVPAQAQQQSGDALTGTLAKVRETGAIAIGYRESSVPFSFLNARKEPIGYSIELCRELVTAIEDTVNKSLVITWVPVTSDSRIDAVESGVVDLECGSTTNNLERQKRVSFSPTTFVSGTKLLVRKGSPIKSFRDLAGRRVAVTTGTTNEKTLRDLSEKFKLRIKLLSARDHADSFGLVKSGEADAFATDDVLLHGLIAHDAAKAEYEIARDYLSFEPYGIMYRKGDAQLGKVINDTFRVLAEDGEIERQYKRWFLRTLPTGQSLNLPMSARLEAILQTMAGQDRRTAFNAGATSNAEWRACRSGRPRRSDTQRWVRSAG